MAATESSQYFECYLGTGYAFDLLRMNAEEFTVTRLGALAMAGPGRDPHIESFGTAVDIMCRVDEYEEAATALAQACASSEDPRARQAAVDLYAHLHGRQIIERDPPGDGQSEAVIWERFVGDSNRDVAADALEAVTVITKQLGVVIRRGRPELTPTLDTLSAVLYKY